jgi:2-polyprenyl-3-methyl-5-hydroxy-6-metoxy-1,4-benzoquinol methylase
MTEASQKHHTYVLKHSVDELRRLEAQGAFLRNSTRDFLQRVGLEPGMRVLDIGCGAGDVSLIAAELVGPTGSVLGIDRNEEVLSCATDRAQEKDLEHVRFENRAIADLEAGARFDAVIGRLVIIHQPNPVETLGRLLQLVRPGGVAGFQEIDVDASYWATHPIPTLDLLWKWLAEVTRRKIFTGNLAAAFMTAFDSAGIVDRRLIRTGAIESGLDSGAFKWVGGFARSLMAGVGGLGVVPAETDLRLFETRFKAEVEAAQACFIPAHFLGAACRLPS